MRDKHQAAVKGLNLTLDQKASHGYQAERGPHAGTTDGVEDQDGSSKVGTTGTALIDPAIWRGTDNQRRKDARFE
jgi:hypothetical protein